MHLKTIFAQTVCALAISGSIAAQELKVGAVMGFTGPEQIWAQNAREGIELALEEVNSAPDSNGKSIKVIFEDSHTDPKTALSAYRKLVDQDKAKIIIGELWAYLTIPLVSVSERDKVLLISPTVMDESIKERSDYFFTFGHKFSGLESGMRRFLELNPNISRPALISFEDYWNNAFTDLAKKMLLERGLKPIEDLRLTEFFPELRTEITTLKRSKADGLIITWRPEVALQRMREQRVSMPLLSSSDSVEAVLFRGGSAELFEGTYFLDWRPSSEFEAKYSAKFGHLPRYEAHNSYEIIRTIAKARALPGDDLRSNLLKISYQGVGGKIDFSEAPFVNQESGRLYQVKGGKFVEIGAAK